MRRTQAVARVSFIAGTSGEWSIVSATAICGDGLALATALRRVEGDGPDIAAAGPEAAWVLRGVTSHERYTEREEKARLVAVQPPLGRPVCDAAALIPIRKSAAWWALAQDERRAIFEARSRHIVLGME